MTRGFKNFLGIVLACIALSALFSSPVGFFDVVVAVMCIIAAILLLKPTESEKAAKKAKQSGNESKSMPTANTTDTAIETVKPTQITTQNEGYCHEPEPPVKPIVEHYSRNDDVVYLRHENSLLRAQLSTDQGDLVDAKSEALKIRAKNEEAKSELLSTKKRLAEVKNELIETEEAALLQSFGLYTPHFEFARADNYKARLLEIRARQKDAVKDGLAVTGNTTWSIDGSQTRGRKMVADIQKLLLRAFNAECDDIVEHVRYNNMTISRLLEIIERKDRSDRHQRQFRYITQSSVVIIDDMMYARIPDEHLPKLYHALTFLNETRSLIVITNRELSTWSNGAEDTHMVETLVSRLTAGSQIIRLT